MTDDMTPAEQARAARWAADWLAAGESPDYPGAPWVVMLREHADDIDPPETVEYLRAERDAALMQGESLLAAHQVMTDKRDAAMQRAERDATLLRKEKAALDAMRAERDKAQRELFDLQAEQDKVVAQFEAVLLERNEARSALKIALTARDAALVERGDLITHQNLDRAEIARLQLAIRSTPSLREQCNEDMQLSAMDRLANLNAELLRTFQEKVRQEMLRGRQTPAPESTTTQEED